MAQVEIVKSEGSHRGYSGRTIRYPLWAVTVDGRPIIGDCDRAFTTLRAAKAAAHLQAEVEAVTDGMCRVGDAV